MRTTHTTTRTRAEKASHAQAVLAEMLTKVARPGYFGAATMTVTLQDGHVQQVKVTTEKQIKV
ncbi:hypothetical protein KOR34_48980 [Posidoniimonas corsicana]|uniref:DUF2292 domain-containing protein n=1 Tax=Posidoniimonas corsicana TaxID=1938618 RepID=A0A5C5UXI6_9BACT|nr:hypothetical protein [Posidoniimonas corsicana]TWT30340.1 hypothetical protein KOR34_48980 [Posidoniimonas corsicana]